MHPLTKKRAFLICNDWLKVRCATLPCVTAAAAPPTRTHTHKHMNVHTHVQMHAHAHTNTHNPTQGACERKLEVGKVPEHGRCMYRVTVSTTGEAGCPPAPVLRHAAPLVPFCGSG